MERIHYIDFAKGIGIILVILGHISYISDSTRIFVVSFHMPLFFILSGILIHLRKETDRPLKDIAKNKFRRMMIPYFLYSTVGILIYIIYYLLTGRDGGFPTVLSDIVQTLTLYGYSVMWFLPAIFSAELLLIAIIRKFRTLPKILAIVMILTVASMILNKYLESANTLYGFNTVFSVFHLLAVAILRVPVCMSFAAIGFFIAAQWSRFQNIGPDKFPPLAIPADIFIGIDLIALDLIFSHINGITDLHFMIFNNVFFYYIAALSGSFGVIFLCKALEKLHNAPPLRLLSYFGVNSLIIMVTHLNFYVLLAAEIGGMHFTKALEEGALKHTVFIILVMVFTLMGEIVLIEVIERVKKLHRKKVSS
ncbi:MAG: acyltransferase [Lachnospiraceae bacterium]|nr:acyltransferase [Lachnospiraceae bacterium]